MDLFNASVDAVGVDGETRGPTPPSEHVFSVPQSLGAVLLGFPGWRWAEPGDWPDGTPPLVALDVEPVPEPMKAEEPPAQIVEAAAVPDPEPVVEPEPAAPVVEDPPAVADPDEGDSIPAQIVASALTAGKDGVTTAAMFAEHGKGAYNALARLAEQGRLVKVGRGLYKHPDA